MAMRRRGFMKIVGGAAAAWPLPARAQKARKLPTIGYLGGNTCGAGKTSLDTDAPLNQKPKVKNDPVGTAPD